jgi:hypothetical protein
MFACCTAALATTGTLRTIRRDIILDQPRRSCTPKPHGAGRNDSADAS